MKITSKYELFILIQNFTRVKFELYVVFLEESNYKMNFVMDYDPPQKPKLKDDDADGIPGWDLVLDMFIRS